MKEKFHPSTETPDPQPTKFSDERQKLAEAVEPNPLFQPSERVARLLTETPTKMSVALLQQHSVDRVAAAVVAVFDAQPDLDNRFMRRLSRREMLTLRDTSATATAKQNALNDFLGGFRGFDEEVWNLIAQELSDQ